MKNKTYEKIINKGLKSARYKYPEPTRRDLLTALSNYKGLQPKVDNFVFDSGNEETLIGLQGTIPIIYRNNTYNIPVCFWLQTDHPSAAPIGFVQPTHDMQIKASQAVDYNGRIIVPYLSEWKYPESSLHDFMQICILVFGQSPPVFSKKSSQSSRNSASASASASVVSNIVNLPPSVTQSNSTEVPVSNLVEYEVQQQTESSGARSRRSESIEREDAVMRASLMSAAEEQMKPKVTEEFMRTKAEVQSLHSTNRELLDGQERINSILSSIGDKIEEVESHEVDLKAKEAEIAVAMRHLTLLETQRPGPDEVIAVPEGAHAQLVEAFAMDAAIDDAIYTLGEGLRLGVLDCEVYLKKVRNLSRKQFLQRVIMDRCKQKTAFSRSASNSSDI